jgi:hypothetical protein
MYGYKEISMNKIKKVVLLRAEGPTSQCGEKVVAGDHIEHDVLDIFREWGRTAPKGGGYDKVDFTVTWEGDSEYRGRFDMEAGGRSGGEDFWTSLRRRLAVTACRRRPAHFMDSHWEHYCKKSEENGWKATCEMILDTCEVP